jgi:uncharacterized protein (DUF2384 family)
MSDEPATSPDDASAERKTTPFRKKFSSARMPADSAERQGRVTTLAWRLLGGRDEAMAFLNNHDEVLGGRPLDLAVASVEGCEVVERAIAAKAAA